jgi:hypothetical protein
MVDICQKAYDLNGTIITSNNGVLDLSLGHPGRKLRVNFIGDWGENRKSGPRWASRYPQ